jgi:hypothetical protein
LGEADIKNIEHGIHRSLKLINIEDANNQINKKDFKLQLKVFIFSVGPEGLEPPANGL